MSVLLSLILVFSALPLAGAADPQPDAASMPYTLWYREPATENYDGWENWSLPIGNSAIGGNVFGRYDTEHITLNEKTMWTGGPAEGRNYRGGNLPEKGQNGAIIRQVQQLFLQGDDGSIRQAQNLCSSHLVGVSDDAGTNGYGTYAMFGDLYLDLNHSGVTNYSRGLDLRTGIATVAYEMNGTRFEREYFTNHPDTENVMVIRLTASGGSETLNFGVRLEPSNDNVRNTGRSAAYTVSSDTIQVAGQLNDNQLRYHGTVQVLADGNSRKQGNGLQIADATEATIVLSMATDYNDVYPAYRTGESAEELAARVNASVEAAALGSYEVLRQNHLTDYGEALGRVSLDLGQTLPQMATNELLNAYKNGSLPRSEQTYLEVLLYQYGRYLLLSSSRGDTLPANLQGLWVGKNDSSWHSDYHLNVNLQMNYWPAYVSNLAECALPMIDYMDALRAPGRVTAADYFGVVSDEQNPENGFIAHTQNNPYGWTCPGWSFDWGWSPAGVPWMLQNVWEYYEFTEDPLVLETQIYPIMAECARFYQQILVEDSQGRLISCPAYSPEHGPRTATNTYEMSLVWQLFHDTILAGQALGADVSSFEETFSRLRQPIEIGTDGQIKEWYEETTFGSCGGQTDNHRHISHLLGLYPGDLFTDAHPDWMEAAKVSMNRRGFNCTGWGLAQRINTWARLHDGENAYTAVHTLVKDKLLPNLWDTHPPFQIDGNFGFTSGINEMLVQSHQGYIEVLPALPEAWHDHGSVDGLLARGNIELGFDWDQGALTQLRLLSRNGGPIQLRLQPGISYRLMDERGNLLPTEPIPNGIRFETTAGQFCILQVTASMSVGSRTGVTTLAKAGEQIQLDADLLTTEADTSVTWSLQYEDGTPVPETVATISETGLVTAVSVEQPGTLVAVAESNAVPGCKDSIRLQLAALGEQELPAAENHFLRGTVTLPTGAENLEGYGPENITDGLLKDGNRLAMKDNHAASTGSVRLSVTVPQACTIDEIVAYERIDDDWGDHSRMDGLRVYAPGASGPAAQVSYAAEKIDNNIQKHVLQVAPMTVAAGETVQVELVRNQEKPDSGITLWELEAYGVPAVRSDNYFLNQTAALPQGYETGAGYGLNWITDGKTPATTPAAGDQDRMAMNSTAPSNGDLAVTIPVKAAGTLDEIVVYERIDHSYGDLSRIASISVAQAGNPAYTTERIHNNIQKHVLTFDPMTVARGQAITVNLKRNAVKTGEGIGLWEIEAYGPADNEAPAEADRAELLAALQEAADFDRSKLDGQEGDFNRALNDARRVANNPNAGQSEIDAAAAALRAAMKVDPDPIPGNDVNFYVFVNGEKQLAAHKTDVPTYKFKDGTVLRQWFRADTLEEVYGPYGFTAAQMTAGTRYFGHEARGGGSIWADRTAKAKSGQFYSPTLDTATEHDVFYLPAQSLSNYGSNTDPALMARESLYTVTVDGQVQYFVSGQNAVVTPEAAPVGKMWRCADAGGQEIPAENGTFTILAIDRPYTVTLVNAPVVDAIEAVGQSLSLEDEIYINNYVTITGFEGVDLCTDGGMLIWKTEPADPSYANAEIRKEGLIPGEASNRYGQITDGIAAKEYADTLWMQIYVRKTDGDYAYGPLTEYSVRTFCEKAVEQNAMVKETAIELAHFGAAAQLNFNYNTDDLANKNMPQGKTWNAGLLDEPAAADTTIKATGDILFEGKSLSLDGRIMANVYFAPSGFTASEAELLYWTDSTVQQTEANAKTVPMLKTGTVFGAQPCGFAAKEYGKTIFVCARMTDAAGKVHYSEIMAYSPEAYAKAVMEQGTNEKLVKTVQQMVLYGESARLYFAK